MLNRPLALIRSEGSFCLPGAVVTIRSVHRTSFILDMSMAVIWQLESLTKTRQTLIQILTQPQTALGDFRPVTFSQPVLIHGVVMREK